MADKKVTTAPDGAARKLSPFDVVDNLCFGKHDWLYRNGIIDHDYLDSYCRFVVDHAMGMSLDTLSYAQDMTERPWLDADMQHDYYFFSVRKAKRYAKWFKAGKDAHRAAIQAEFQVGPSEARYILSILTPEQVDYIVKRQGDTGGMLARPPKK